MSFIEHSHLTDALRYFVDVSEFDNHVNLLIALD